MLSAVPGAGTWRVALTAQVGAAPITAHCQTKAECYFHFSPVFVKQKSSSVFFQLEKAGTSVGLL